MNASIRPECPKCGMHMIIIKDFPAQPEHRTFECLRCGHIAEPGAAPVKPTATPVKRKGREVSRPEQLSVRSGHTADTHI
jgi:uncharacterized Zn finger protein